MFKKKLSNRATTPDDKLPKEKRNKFNTIFFAWNLVTILFYVCYTFFVVYKIARNTFLSKIIIYLLGIYVISFVILIFVNIGDQKKLNTGLKNYKSATNFLKYIVKIINFVLLIITAISAFINTGKVDVMIIFYALISIFILFISIMLEIGKIIVRKNMHLVKQNFLDIYERPKKNKKK